MVCISPAELFLIVSMVAASKLREPLAFGNDTLEKDENWELTWLLGERVPESQL